MYNSDIDTKINKCKLKYNEEDVSLIVPRIFLGNVSSSRNKNFLKKNNVKYIFTIMKEFDPIYEGEIKYYHIPIKDSEMCGKNMDKLYDYISNTIKNIITTTNSSILIHCKQGHHRSAAFVAAFILKYIPDLNFNYVIQYINNIRVCALRRDACVLKALLEYYNKLHNIKYNYKLVNHKTGMIAIKK